MALIYSVGWLVGWPIVTFLIAEQLRNLGKFTFADVTSFRLGQTDIRILAACGSLVTVAFYLIAQMVGAGKLIQLLFGLDYWIAVVLVGGLMMIYVTFGGMKATTWVQIIKAVLLLLGATFMAGAVLYKFGFSPEALFAKATEVHPKGIAIMEPGSLISNPLSAISLGLALMFGTAGLPHILMRFFTVKDAQAARKSVFYATGFIGYFYILTFIIGFGAITLVSTDLAFLDAGILEKTKSGIAAIKGGSNMAAIHLADAVGGNLFLGFISAVAFATILAVVSGLALAGASSISHDIYAMVIKGGNANEQDEIRVSKIATLFLGVLAIILGIIFENQNVAFMVGLAFAIAASCNFPVLVMSIFWKGLTTRGAIDWGLPRSDKCRGRRHTVARRVGSDARLPQGVGAGQAGQPGAVLDVACVRRHMAIFDPGPQRAGHGRPGGFDAQLCVARPESAHPEPPRIETGNRKRGSAVAGDLRQGSVTRPDELVPNPARQDAADVQRLDSSA